MVKRGVIAVIPARGGSTRIPLKPLAEINSKPLLARTIQLAKSTGLFDEIVVSTDNPDIAKIALKLGASAPFLRKKYMDEHSPVSLATIWTMQKITEISEWNQETIVVQLMLTCPFIKPSTIIQMFELFMDEPKTPLISCTRAEPLTSFVFEIDDNGKRKSLLTQNIHTRTQDQRALFLPSGAAWFSSLDCLLQYQTYLTPDARYFQISAIEGFDIDTPEQLQLASSIENSRHNG